MIELLVIVVLVLAVFALIGSIWGKETAQGCFGVFAGCGAQLLVVIVVGIVLGIVLCVLINVGR